MHSRRFNALRQRRRTICRRLESRRNKLRAPSDDDAPYHISDELEIRLQLYKAQERLSHPHPDESVSLTTRSGTSNSNWTYAKKPSIAAASILGIIVFFAIVYLVVWYVKRERSRRLRELQSASQDPFCLSTLTLTEDTSKTLDDFLMKEVQPERTSLMFSRSRSPSFTFLVDESDRQSPISRLYPTSSDTSSKSLSKSSSSVRVSADAIRPGMMMPDLSPSTSNTYHKAPSRASISSAVPPSQRSSALWTTTTSSTTDSSSNSTILSPVFTQKEAQSSMTSGSQSGGRSIHSVTSPAGSLARSGHSSASRASSRYSAQRAIDQNATIRRAHNSSHRRSLSTIHSPIELGLSTTTSGQSTESTQPSTNSSSSPLLFRLSVELPHGEVQ